MKFNTTPLPGVIHVELDVFRDGRGYFLESFHAEKYDKGGVRGPFVQDNISKSSQGTLRGLHAQLSRPQGKLVHVVTGEIWDVAVDIRPSSPTYTKWYGVSLTENKPCQLYIPVGFAHGFCVLSDTAEVQYKCTDLYDPASEIQLAWNDPDLAITWPVHNPVLSAKDSKGLSLRDLEEKLTVAFRSLKSK